MLTTTSGSSVMTASAMPSALSAMPGPLDAVMPIAPPHEAPIAAPTPAISSSTCSVVTSNVL